MKILVADDDELLRNLLGDILEKEGYEVTEAEDGDCALESFRKNPEFKLVILDIMMPKKNGFEVLEEIRRSSTVPVIMLTALGDSEDEIEGFRLGACDYVAKPFHRKVLLARIRAALEYKSGLAEEAHGDMLCFKALKVDLNGCRVYSGGEEVILTNKEYRLLLYLIENRNIVLTRDQILERIWGFDYEGDIRTIDTHIKMLRNDLGECGDYIRTIRGIGYVFQWEERL
ncbi:MAG: response regulator transcription factor [Eubacteriales bacterium]|nr:response regulator transcription factor [Eubacteriales bacterium]